MKLLMENWRKFINEEAAAFHGVDMEPEEMSRKGDLPACATPPAGNPEHGWADKQWSTDDKGKGCPDFSHDRGISSNHPDIKQAVEYLDNIMGSGDKLIAYSRGGAVALAALSISKTKPFVIFVAPAWRRGWVNGIENPTYSSGVIIHGTADESVPLWHSADLSLKTGMPLYVFKGMKHINILKHKSNPESGRLLSQKEKEELMRSAKSLNEKVFADYEADKGEWVDVPVGDLEHDPDPENIDLTDEIYSLIDVAYNPIGGHFDFQSAADIPGKHDNWLAMDWDEDPQPDVLRVGRSKPAGTKMTAAGHDGQGKSKGHYIRKTIELLNSPGHYAEMSKRIADIMIEDGVPYVDNPAAVRKALGFGKPIEWLGDHPEGKHPEYKGWYRRSVGGHAGELKIMLGAPKFSGPFDYDAIGEQTEPFQRKVRAKHDKMKKKLVGSAGGSRSKSAPPGAGGS